MSEYNIINADLTISDELQENEPKIVDQKSEINVELSDKQLIYSSEPENSEKINVSLLMECTGTDEIVSHQVELNKRSASSVHWEDPVTSELEADKTDCVAHSVVKELKEIVTCPNVPDMNVNVELLCNSVETDKISTQILVPEPEKKIDVESNNERFAEKITDFSLIKELTGSEEIVARPNVVYQVPESLCKVLVPEPYKDFEEASTDKSSESENVILKELSCGTTITPRKLVDIDHVMETKLFLGGSGLPTLLETNEKKCDNPCKDTVLDQSPRNELKLAITNGDLFLVRESIENLENRLIELNIDVLIHAIENGHLSILEYIIDKGAYDNIIRNNRLYDISDSFGHDHITRFLLEYNGITLNEACRIGDTVAVRFFLDKNPNNMFNDGREKGSNYYYALIASLNTAARYGQLKVVELLVQNGAKSTHEMIQLAKNHNNLLIVDFLEKHLTQTCDENNSIAQEIEWNGKLNSISRRNVPMEELIMNDLSTTDCIVTMYFGPSIALHKIILKDKVNENFSKYLFSVMYPEWIHETFQFLYNKGRFTKKSFTPIFKNLRQILVPDTDFYKDFCKMSIDYFKKKHLKMTRNDFKDLSCFELLLLMQSESDTQPYSFFYVFMQWANLQADTDLKHLSSFGVTLMKSPSCEQGYVVSVLKEFPSGVDKIFNCSDLIGIF